MNVGPTGPTGFQGPSGPTGPSGSSITGPTGPTGSTITGPTGSTITGSTGSTGESFRGPTGASITITGSTGQQGSTGLAGSSITGSTGPTGSSITGPTGPTGLGSSWGDYANKHIDINNQNLWIDSNYSFNTITGRNNIFICKTGNNCITSGSGNVFFGAADPYNIINVLDGTSSNNVCSCITNSEIVYNYVGLQAPLTAKNVNDVVLDGITFTNVINSISGSVLIGNGNISQVNDIDNVVCICMGNTTNPLINNSVFMQSGSLGNAPIYSGVSVITALSDKRDKINIKRLKSGLEVINSIKPIKYDIKLRDDPDDLTRGKRIGFSAQNLQEIMTSDEKDYLKLVDELDPNILKINQSNLIPILVNALQELINKKNELKKILYNKGLI